MDAEDQAKLRAPFAPHEIGKLPKPTKKDNPKGKCKECGGWHGLPAVHLDYVGHAAVTDRLLQVDPEWSWAPFSQSTDGLPAIVKQGSEWVLWINLTICGMTRPGVGIVSDGSFELHKQLIGDAIRNAAMRFGVALDLWSKEDLNVETEPKGVLEQVLDQRRADVAIYVPVAEAKKRLLSALGGDKGAAEHMWADWWGATVPTGSVSELDLDELVAKAKAAS